MAATTETTWPRYLVPGDLTEIEATPLAERGLPASTYDALRRTAARCPDDTALLLLPDGKRWQQPEPVTYAELLGRVHRVGNAFSALGVGRTTAVGLLSPNTGGLVAALLAAQAVGIAAPVNPALSEEHVESLLHLAGARVLVAAGPELDPAVWELARRTASRLGLAALLALRPVGAGEQAAPLEALPGVTVAYLDQVAGEQRADRLEVPDLPGPDDLAAFFHTGGTTGTPKLAAHTHAMEVVDAWSVAAIATLDDRATVLAALPLFHVNALVVTTLAPLMRGQRVLWAGPQGYRDTDLVRHFWQVVAAYGVNGMSAVPSVYAVLAGIPVDADISTLRLCVVGAAPLPSSTRERWFDRTGVPLAEGYGLTEATCASARSFPEDPRPGTVGQRLPYQQVRAVDADPVTGAWRDLPPGEVGTLLVAGPTVFPGYVAGRTDAGPLLDASDKVRDGWLDTGDLGSVSADGFVSLAGRAKDVIIRGGHNIDPVVVETALLSHPAVTDAGVVGRLDRHAGEVPVAFVVVADPGVDPDELRRWASERVPEPAAAPKAVTVLPALPLTAVGKLSKLTLRVLAAREELGRALTQAGYPVPVDPRWCDQVDGRLTVALPAPDGAEQRRAVEDVLGGYAVDWHLVYPAPATDDSRAGTGDGRTPAGAS